MTARKVLVVFIAGLSAHTWGQTAFSKPSPGWNLYRDELSQRVVGAVFRERKNYALYLDALPNLEELECSDLSIVKKTEGEQTILLHCKDGDHDVLAPMDPKIDRPPPFSIVPPKIGERLLTLGFQRTDGNVEIYQRSLNGKAEPTILVTVEKGAINGVLVSLQAVSRGKSPRKVEGNLTYVRSDAERFMQPSQLIFDWNHHWRVAFRPEMGLAYLVGFSSNAGKILDQGAMSLPALHAVQSWDAESISKIVGAALIYFDAYGKTFNHDIGEYNFPMSVSKDGSRLEVRFFTQDLTVNYEEGLKYQYELRPPHEDSIQEWASPVIVLFPNLEDQLIGYYRIQAERLLTHAENLPIFRSGEKDPDGSEIDLERVTQLLHLDDPKAIDWLQSQYPQL